MKITIAILLLGLFACGPKAAHLPEGAVDRYVRALNEKDFSDAYELMSDDYKRTHSKDDFVRMMKNNPDEVRLTVIRLKAAKNKMEVRARVEYGELKDELHLIQTNKGWKIAQDPIAFYPQDAPRRALRSFLRALELKRYDVILRFVPSEYSKYMSADELKAAFEGEQSPEIKNRIRLLRANVDAPIERQGDSARMRFGDHHFEVIFIKEEGVWKIEDPF